MLVYDSNIENYDYFSGSYYLSTYPSSNHHQIIKPLMEKEYRIFADRCRPVEIASEKNPNFRSQELIFFKKLISTFRMGQSKDSSTKKRAT